jgi:hypothetical protein
MMATSYTIAPVFGSCGEVSGRSDQPHGAGTLSAVQTRYLLIASLVTLFAILAASAVWFLMAA